MYKLISQLKVINITALFIGIAINSSTVFALDWQANLVPVEKREGSEVLKIKLNVPTNQLNNLILGVALDGIDISTVVNFEAGHIVYKPVVTLTPGLHELMLVEFDSKGSANVRGKWEFEVMLKTSTNYNVGVDMNISHRVIDDGLSGDPGKTQGQGNVQLGANTTVGKWTILGEIPLLYDTNIEQNTATSEPNTAVATNNSLPVYDQRKLELGDYRFSIANSGFNAVVGHQQQNINSLVMQGFSRRGTGLNYQWNDRAGLSVFRYSSADIHGLDSKQYIYPDSDNSISGMSITAKPLDSGNETVAISAVYVSGEGADNSGAAIGGDSSIGKGNAKGLVIDGNFLNRHIKIRGEYAKSDYNPDAGNPAGKSEDANAYRGLVSYVPWHDMVLRDKPLMLEIGVENTNVDTYFHSITNPLLPTDRKTFIEFVRLNWSGLNTQLSVGTDKDNVSGQLPSLPTKTDKRNISLSYTPEISITSSGNQAAKYPWYGQPTFNVDWISSSQSLITPIPNILDQLRDTEQYTLTAAFSYASWSWNLSSSYGYSDDSFGLGEGSHTHSTQLQATFRINKDLYINPMLSYGKNNYTSLLYYSYGPAVPQDKVTKTRISGITATYQITKDINTNFGITTNRFNSSGDDNDSHTTDYRANLRYKVFDANESHAGILLGLDGYSRKISSDSVVEQKDSYQVMLTVAVNWAASGAL